MPLTAKKAGGIVRVNRARLILCACVDCDAVFGSTGTAASHARAARHRVEVDYSARFAFVPGELIDGLVLR